MAVEAGRGGAAIHPDLPTHPSRPPSITTDSNIWLINGIMHIIGNSICACTRACTCTCSGACTCTCTCTCTCAYACLYLYLCLYLCLYLYLFLHLCLYLCLCRQAPLQKLLCGGQMLRGRGGGKRKRSGDAKLAKRHNVQWWNKSMGEARSTKLEWSPSCRCGSVGCVAISS